MKRTLAILFVIAQAALATAQTAQPASAEQSKPRVSICRFEYGGPGGGLSLFFGLAGVAADVAITKRQAPRIEVLARQVYKMYEDALATSGRFTYIRNDQLITTKDGRGLSLSEASAANHLAACIDVFGGGGPGFGWNKKAVATTKWNIVGLGDWHRTITTNVASPETHGKFPDPADPNLHPVYLELAKETVNAFFASYDELLQDPKFAQHLQESAALVAALDVRQPPPAAPASAPTVAAAPEPSPTPAASAMAATSVAPPPQAVAAAPSAAPAPADSAAVPAPPRASRPITWEPRVRHRKNEIDQTPVEIEPVQLGPNEKQINLIYYERAAPVAGRDIELTFYDETAMKRMVKRGRTNPAGTLSIVIPAAAGGASSVFTISTAGAAPATDEVGIRIPPVSLHGGQPSITVKFDRTLDIRNEGAPMQLIAFPFDGSAASNEQQVNIIGYDYITSMVSREGAQLVIVNGEPKPISPGDVFLEGSLMTLAR